MGGFYYGHSLGNQIPSHQKPLAYNIIVERITGFLLEFSHQMVFTDVISGGKLIYGQIILQVVIDLLQDFGNLRVKRVGFSVKNILFLQKNTVQVYHKLQK